MSDPIVEILNQWHKEAYAEDWPRDQLLDVAAQIREVIFDGPDEVTIGDTTFERRWFIKEINR